MILTILYELASLVAVSLFGAMIFAWGVILWALMS